MALFHVFETVENRNTGVPMSGVQVRAKFDDTDVVAPIYASQDGTAFNPANYCLTDSDGMYSFYLESGEYTLEYLIGGVLIKAIENFRPVEVGPSGPANSSYNTTSELESADTSNVSAILAEAGKAGTFTIRDYVDFTAQVAADVGKVNYVRSVFDPTRVWVRASILSTAAAQTGASSGLTVDGELAAKATLSGVARTATNLGTFTGSTIADNIAIKPALQALETAVENTTGNAANKANASALGVAATDANLGTFTGSIIPDNQTAKAAIQALETSAEARITAETGISGSSLIGFRQAGTSPLTRTVQDELRRTIDASQFTGFDPTATTDSTVAVQNALNLASALGGGIVTIPNGARVLLLSAVSLTIPAQCALMGPYTGGVDNGGTNLSFPWGTMGGALVLDAGPGRVILCKGSINGLLIHRKGMTFPSTSAGSDYTGEAVHLAGDGANAQNCMFLGFKKGCYARNWQRIFVYNCKYDCTAAAGDSCIDIRQAGDTSMIYKCDAWPYAGGGSNTLNTRAGAFVTLKGRNDWTQVVQCQEYGYQYGYDLQNEADDSAAVFGPANVRIIQCRSDDGWAGTAGSHGGKIGIRLGDASNTVKAFDVLIDGFQGSCNTVTGIYSNLEAGMVLKVVNSFTWNGAQYGLVYQKGGDLIVMGGGNRGDGPGVPTAYGQYSIAYDAGGVGRLTVGGGFESRKVTLSHIRISAAADSINIDWNSIYYDTSAPVFDNAAATLPTVASAADISLSLRRPESCFFLTGNATITSMGPAHIGRRVSFICTAAAGPTFTNNSNMRVNGNANFTVTVANTYVEFIGTANGTTSQWRMVGAPSA